MVQDIVRRARSRFQQDGFVELCRRAFDTGCGSILQELLIRSNLLLSTNDLRARCEFGSLWVLDQQTYDPTELQSFEERVGPRSADKIRKKTWGFNQAFVAELRQVVVLGSYALPVTSDGKIVSDVIHWDPHSDLFPNREMVRAVRATGSELPFQFLRALGSPSSIGSLPTLECACVVRGRQGMNYYSWLLKHLARLRGVRKYEQETGNTVTLIVPPNLPEYAQETLRILGYESQCITWHGGPVQVDKFVVPSHPEPTPETIQWIQSVGRQLAPPDQPGNRDTNGWIYISRQKAGRRRLENYSEIELVFEQYDVTPIRCEELPLEEQVRVFREADGVIGIHGAGLSNIIWGDDLAVIEIFNNAGKTVYRNLSDVMDHKYDHVFGEPVENADSEINHDIILNPDEIATTIKSHQA